MICKQHIVLNQVFFWYESNLEPVTFIYIVCQSEPNLIFVMITSGLYTESPTVGKGAVRILLEYVLVKTVAKDHQWFLNIWSQTFKLWIISRHIKKKLFIHIEPGTELKKSIQFHQPLVPSNNFKSTITHSPITWCVVGRLSFAWRRS